MFGSGKKQAEKRDEKKAPALTKDEAVIEASLETGEVVADVLMKGDLIADIPLIGLAVKACRAVDSVRNQIFASKVARFMVQLENLPPEERETFKEKIRTSEDGGKKVGETLLLVLERITDLDKPKLLAQLFVAYLEGVITSDELRRMAQSVDMAFGDDLAQLLEVQNANDLSGDWMEHLVPSGLARQAEVSPSWGGKPVTYIVSPLGHKLRNAYLHGRKKLG